MSSDIPDGKNGSIEQPEDEAVTLIRSNSPILSAKGSADAESREPEELNPDAVQIRFAGVTAVGLVREHNEDNLVNANLTTGKLYPRGEYCADVVGARGNIFAVCDGMGGAAAGEVASQMAVDIIFNTLREGEPPADRDELAGKLVKAVEQAGEQIYKTAQTDQSRRGMGTTVTAAVLLDKILFIAQVGDSRAYLLRNGEVKQLTKDQSLVSQLIEAGHLTEAEAETFEHSNIILQALGTSQTVQVDLTFIELRKDDRLLLCSDGLSGMVDSAILHQTLKECSDPHTCCEKLIEHANEGGGHDNITVVIVDFDGNPLRLPAPGESFGYMQYPLPIQIPSPTPAADPSVNTRRTVRVERHVDRIVPPPHSSHLWLIAGTTALVAAIVTLALVRPRSNSKSEELLSRHHLKPAKQKILGKADRSKPESREKDYAPVTVRIRTEVENALLIVNGEPRGPISAGETRIIELAPGAYRFEAQAGGSVAAATVATVKPETPLEIALNLPNGALTKPIDNSANQKPVSQKKSRAAEDSENLNEKRETASTSPASKTNSSIAASKALLPNDSKDVNLEKKLDVSAKKETSETRPSSPVGAKSSDTKPEATQPVKTKTEQSTVESATKASDIPDNPF
jgi:PPM family protein phosphatase